MVPVYGTTAGAAQTVALSLVVCHSPAFSEMVIVRVPGDAQPGGAEGQHQRDGAGRRERTIGDIRVSAR